MRKCIYDRAGAMLVVAILLWFSTSIEGVRSISDAVMGSNVQGSLREDNDLMISKEGTGDELLKGIYSTGSSLPDCSHACGPCFPCKRVMVSFECSVSESCPIVYRCMCKGKYYQVPSN